MQDLFDFSALDVPSEDPAKRQQTSGAEADATRTAGEQGANMRKLPSGSQAVAAPVKAAQAAAPVSSSAMVRSKRPFAWKPHGTRRGQRLSEDTPLGSLDGVDSHVSEKLAIAEDHVEEIDDSVLMEQARVGFDMLRVSADGTTCHVRQPRSDSGFGKLVEEALAGGELAWDDF
mmetsp:Transcript_75555/g.179515  ORF Transcript_75555/g.179515 Transcript_75555/m.179515 type:complete len:174 (-) Transcript_75555:160-681(-)